MNTPPIPPRNLNSERLSPPSCARRRQRITSPRVIFFKNVLSCPFLRHYSSYGVTLRYGIARGKMLLYSLADSTIKHLQTIFLHLKYDHITVELGVYSCAQKRELQSFGFGIQNYNNNARGNTSPISLNTVRSQQGRRRQLYIICCVQGRGLNS